LGYILGYFFTNSSGHLVDESFRSFFGCEVILPFFKAPVSQQLDTRVAKFFLVLQTNPKVEKYDMDTKFVHHYKNLPRLAFWYTNMPSGNPEFLVFIDTSHLVRFNLSMYQT
jgi:hypothetical protein